ncbi:MAG TPA: phosphatase PAP2 family protein [Spirochaetia bacterium]|nr:phosphatase PAP2 family protein [Spirochaetaceae bacterium]HPE89365.1 phosphatase PAP2 family protein [Spirochaetales bacterium]HRW23693.1 phosphatase PAP2 family protein [Spirochaetia bacterium]
MIYNDHTLRIGSRAAGRGRGRAALAMVAALALTTSLAAQEATPLPAYPLDAAGVNAFDRPFMAPYDGTLDAVSDYGQYAAFLTPGVFALSAPVSDWFGVGAMYAGSALLSYAARTVLKAAIVRERPYLYFDGAPADAIAEGDHLDSFPSGHAIMAFTGAAFTATLYAERYPDAPERLPATIAAYALAALTAGLRVASGSHFVSDVLAGAAIGSAFGFAVPFAASRLGWLD